MVKTFFNLFLQNPYSKDTPPSEVYFVNSKELKIKIFETLLTILTFIQIYNF